jgi:hypothetical protein
MLDNLLKEDELNYPFIRYTIKRATKYRINRLVELVLNKLDLLLPVLRETIVYLRTVCNESLIIKHEKEFANIWKSEYIELDFVNRWVSYLFQHEKFREFNKIYFKYNYVKTIRDRAMFAHQLNDTRWLRDYRDSVEQLGYWDKRAILYTSSILPYDEMKNWTKSVSAAGDIVDKVISVHLSSKNRSK